MCYALNLNIHKIMLQDEFEHLPKQENMANLAKLE
ncbi:N-6 DNA methylase ['Nostoc azollae' 0708]|jgi:hypothetical protein|uniref:N-6 DNA methylase n=1 Tax=Nostoc azollae (strain 0708) TaxID=551115 RepID=D7E2H1_NOSA0|nr:N-6 DNA methylase ['Nostoc azollae' 0708]